MTERHLSAVPDRSDPKPNFLARRVGVFVAAIGVSALALFGYNQLTDTKPTESNLPVCLPSEETHEFVFDRVGQGVNDAIHDIEGSGEGEGAECWEDAKAIVDKELNKQNPYGPTPENGETIEIPNSITLVDNLDSSK